MQQKREKIVNYLVGEVLKLLPWASPRAVKRRIIEKLDDRGLRHIRVTL